MTAVEITTEFSRHNYPFWGCVNPVSSAALKDRGGRSKPVVAVFNPNRNDYRLKVWLVAKGSTDEFVVNGQKFQLPTSGDGLFTGPVDRLALSRALQGPPVESEDEEPPEPGEYLDACIETIFAEDRGRPWGNWQGDVSSFPAWMRAVSISITPPVSGGNWHAITLKTGLDSAAVDQIQVIRINGVWCVGTPVIDRFDAQGQGHFNGTFMYLCDPDDMEEVRSYGDGMSAPTLDNEPIPPRVRSAIWILRRLVNLPYAIDAAWQADCKQLWNGLVGMCAGQGQLDVNASQMHRYARRTRHYENLVAKYWQKSGSSSPMRVWVEQEGGKKVQGWFSSAEEMNKIMRSYRDRTETYVNSITKSREQYIEALARCEEREAEYADVIPALYPARG